MSFRYELLNIKILDDVRPILSKPSPQWTDKEALQVAMFIEAATILDLDRCAGGRCGAHVECLWFLNHEKALAEYRAKGEK